MKPVRYRHRNLLSSVGKASFPAALLLYLVFGLLFSVQSAFAQAVLGKPERLIITPSVNVSGKYDTNINQDAENEREDYSTIYSPGATITYRRPHTTLSANYVWNFEEYDDFVELNNLDQSGSGSFTHQFSPNLLFSGGVSYSQTEEEDVDLDLTVQGRLAESAREEQSSENIGADAAIQLGYIPRLPITLTYAFVDNLNSAADEVDELSHNFGAHGTYLLAPERGHRIDLSYTVSMIQENEDTQRAPGDPALNFAANDITEHVATVSYTHVFDPTLSATAGGGPSIVSHSDNPNIEGDVDPIFFANLTKRWTRTGVGVNWALDTGRGGGFEGTTETQSVGLVADHSPLPNLGLAVSVNYQESNEQNSGTSLDTDESQFVVSPSINYRFLRYFNLSGGYSYSRIEGEGDFTGSEFQGFDAALSLILRPDFPQFTASYSYSHNESEANDDNFERELLLFSISYFFSFGL